MDKRLIGALLSVSSTSASAKSLASKLLAECQTDLVKQLYDKISQLELHVAELTSVITEPEHISDEEGRELAVSLATRLRDIEPGALRKYDAQNLKQYPKFVRSIVARVLINKAVELGQRPMDVWYDVIALDGDLK